MELSLRSRLGALLAAGVLAVAVPVAVTASAARASSAPGANTPKKLATGLLASRLPGASPFGTTPANTPEQVSFILRERNEAQLESAVSGGLSSFDSVDGFAARYGATPAVVSALTGYLAKFGIKAKAYPGSVDVSATGTAGAFDAALECSQQDYHVPSQPGASGGGDGGGGGRAVPAQTVYSATGAPELPYGIGKYVLAVLGLTNYSPFVSNMVSLRGSASPSVTAPGAPTSHLPSDFAARYGLTALSKQASGSGETIGVVTLAAIDPGAPQYFWSKVAKIPSTGRTVRVDNVDGGPGAPSDAAGAGETDLDVEQSGALAPGANVVVYQAPNTDAGFIDAFFAAAGSDLPDTLSTSWGEAETVVAAQVAAGQEPAAYEAAFDEVFLELADQGQSAFVAAGDAGAYDDSDELGTTELSVSVIADSPYVTAAGGTTLPWSGKVTGPKGSAKVSVAQQEAWNHNYLWQAKATVEGTSYAAAAIANVEGGGGGFSAIEPEPSYQYLVTGTSSYHGLKYLTPTGYRTLVDGTDLVEPASWSVTAKPSVVSGSGSGRALPDLSADADPYTGYLLYEPSLVATGSPALIPGVGGTSYVAPQFNGSAAVIDSYLGHRTGLWNPSLYALAAGPDSPVTPLSTVGHGNDNVFYTGNPGQQFNEATGLGVPNLTKFAAELAG